MTTTNLNVADRCDRCGAQAYLLLGVAVPDSGDRELLLCAHHYQQHEHHLAHSGVQVLLDHRRRLQRADHA